MAAMSSRVHMSVASRRCSDWLPPVDRALLYRLGSFRRRRDPVHVDARCDDEIWIQIVCGIEYFDLGDGHPTGGGDERVEVAGGVSVGQVALSIRAMSVHQCDVRDDRLFEDAGPA